MNFDLRHSLRWAFIPAAIFLVCLCRAASAEAEPLRIMCLGDSITAGYTDNPTWSEPFEFGYRSGLYAQLTDAGCDVQFVGDSPEPWHGGFGLPQNAPSLDLRPWGQDKHRGYGGATLDFVKNIVASCLHFDDPDVVLLMIGINDIPMGSGGNPANQQNALQQIVETIVTAKPDVYLIVAQITPYAVPTGAIVQYNDFIRNTLIPTMNVQGRRVSTVDQYSLFINGDNTINASLFSNGSNHPNNAAYDLMAENWFQGMKNLGLVSVPEPATPLFAVFAMLVLSRARRLRA